MKIADILSEGKRPRREWTVVNATPHEVTVKTEDAMRKYPSKTSLRCDYARGPDTQSVDGIRVTALGTYSVPKLEPVDPGTLLIVSPIFADALRGSNERISPEALESAFGTREVRVCVPDTNPDVVERDENGQIVAAGGLIEYTDGV